MPGTENDLRELLASVPTPEHRLDASTIIARSRLRRLPRQLGAGAVGILAIAGIAVVTVPSMLVTPPTTISTMEQPAADSSTESMIKRAPADRLNLCTAPIAEVAPSRLGLQLDVVLPASAPVGTAPVEAVVRLTNTSAATVTGTTGPAPAITLSQNGLTLWHSNGPEDSSAVLINLAPGETLEYAASFVPVRCDVDDDLAEQFRPDLPPLPAGIYELSAAIDFLPDAPPTDGSTPGLDLVTGPRAFVTLD